VNEQLDFRHPIEVRLRDPDCERIHEQPIGAAAIHKTISRKLAVLFFVKRAALAGPLRGHDRRSFGNESLKREARVELSKLLRPVGSHAMVMAE